MKSIFSHQTVSVASGMMMLEAAQPKLPDAFSEVFLSAVLLVSLSPFESLERKGFQLSMTQNEALAQFITSTVSKKSS